MLKIICAMLFNWRETHSSYFKWSVLFILVLPITNLKAEEELPLWELGLGAGVISQPYYPGSDETRNLFFPVPLPVYRGDVFKSDDDGVRAQLLKNDRLKIDVSLDFNYAIDSDDIDVRQGMDDIDSVLQIGPSLEILLSETDNSQWFLNLPLRANFEIGDGVDGSGYTFAPNLTYFRSFDLGKTKWRAGFALGPQFGSSDYHNVYYGVEDEFATDFRSRYDAEGGYSGSRALLTLKSHNKKRLWVFFMRYDNISSAEFEDSPLVENSGGLSAGIIYSRYLFKSKETVSK